KLKGLLRSPRTTNDTAVKEVVAADLGVVVDTEEEVVATDPRYGPPEYPPLLTISFPRCFKSENPPPN
ncbi:unnamed protein product, partial [Arabidopsis halleri]